jgi:hypothetical protein
MLSITCTDELTKHTAEANTTPKGKRLLKLLSTEIDNLLTPPPFSDEQRVDKVRRHDAHEDNQRVIYDTPIITMLHITKAKPIMKSCNPTIKPVLKITPRLHRQVTQNNTPGVIPAPHIIEPIPLVAPLNPKQPTCTQPRCGAKAMRTALPSDVRQRIVTQQAINVLTIRKQAAFSLTFTPRALMKHARIPIHFEHFTNAMVHPVTGCTISSYKKLMHGLSTAETWQTAFGKDLGGMTQGCNKNWAERYKYNVCHDA